jgi:peptide/nickel transport system substrate-binding protein
MSDERAFASFKEAVARTVSRRTALKVFGTGAVASLLAACGAQATSAPATTAPTSAPASSPGGGTATATPAQSAASAAPTATTAVSAPAAPTGTITLANPNEPNFIDPAQALENYEFSVLRNTYEGLVAWNSDWTDFVPALATSWESNADATVWTFHLRQGITFHDGTPFDSSSAKATFVHYDPAKTNWGFLMSGITKIDDSDPATLVLTFSTPSPDILRNQVFVKMMSSKLLSDGQAANMCVGTGPYKWVSRAKGTSITLGANTSYWNSPAGGPHYQTAVLQSISDTNAAVSALEAGSVNIVPAVAPIQAQQLQSNSSIALSTTHSWLVIHLIYRTDQGPLKDVRVRQAIAYGIDRDAIIKDILLGHAQKATSLMPPGTYGRVDPATTYDYNPTMAKSLLAAAGYGSGLNIALASGNTAPYPLVAQAIANQLKQVGINMQADALEPGVAVNDVLVSATPKHTILLSTYGWVNGGPFHFGVETIINHPHYTGADLVALVNTVNHTPDGPARLKALADAQELYAQVIPDFPLYYPTVTDAYSNNVHDYSAAVDAYQIDFTRAYSG